MSSRRKQSKPRSLKAGHEDPSLNKESHDNIHIRTNHRPSNQDASDQTNVAIDSMDKLSDHDTEVHITEMPYSCEFCRRPFRHKRSRDRHMKLHTGDKNFACDLCDSAFSRSDHLKNHMKSHSNGRWLVPTDEANYHDLKHTHMTYSKEKMHTKGGNSLMTVSESKTMHQCRQCLQTFAHLYQLDDHLKTHALEQRNTDKASMNSMMPVQSLEYQCTHCAKQSIKQVFVSLSALEQHVTHMHSGKGLSLLSCPKCEAAFPTVPALNNHIKQEHTTYSSPVMESASSKSYSEKHCKVVTEEVTRSDEEHDLSSSTYVCAERLSCNVSNRVPAVKNSLIGHAPDERRALSKPSSPSCNSTQHDNSSPLDLSARSPPTATISEDKVAISFQLIDQGNHKYQRVHSSAHNSPSDPVLFSQQRIDKLEKDFISTTRCYICRCCKRTYPDVDVLQTHLVVEHSRKSYKCLLCSEHYQTEVDLKIHMTVEHSNERRIYWCGSCGAESEDLNMLKTHILRCHADILPRTTDTVGSLSRNAVLKLHKCSYCEKEFLAESDLKKHIVTHQKVFDCILCDERFAVEYLRDKHMHSTHSCQVITDDKLMVPTDKQKEKVDILASPFWCGICDQLFHSEDVYEEHKRRSHSSVKSWTGRLADMSTIKSPKPNVQSKLFSTTCKTCGKAFKTYTELDKHSRVHFGPVILTCIICDQVFSNLSDMSKHKLQHCKLQNTKPCVLCPTRIDDADTYLSHAHLHMEVDTTTMCCVCKHKITSQVELELHANYHFPEKLTRCCASCKKPCPYSIELSSPLEENPKFLLCQECLVIQKQSSSPVLTDRLTMSQSESLRSLPDRLPSSTTSAIYCKETNKCTHKCGECDTAFKSVLELESHECVKKKCSNCLKKFKLAELVCKLNSSICLLCDSTNSKDLWRCDKCKLTFTKEEKYQKHNCNALGDGKLCSICQGRFNHAQLLLRGQKLVCRSCNRKMCVCSRCDGILVGGEGHTCHLKCEKCGNMFDYCNNDHVSVPTLCSECNDRHKLDTDRNSQQLLSEKVYQCIKCQMTCQSERQIQEHILDYHLNDTTHRCYLCSSVFSTPAKLQFHLIEHNFSSDERLHCPKCNWVTSDAASLMNHCAAEHSLTNRSHVCSYCLQSFFFETELVNHLASLHKISIKPTKEFASAKRPYCTDGDEKLQPEVKSIKKETTSDNEDELFCSECDIELASHDLYYSHVVMHHGSGS